MSAILPFIRIDSSALLAKHFLPYQSNWIQAEETIHAVHKQAIALAEKSVRIGWTWADAFKNVRKRLRYKKRDYLFATKDYPSALEYIVQAKAFAEFFNFTRAIVSHGEDYLKINRLDAQGLPTTLTEEIKIGYIKFDNGSRIIAFSAHPQAMAVYGGDVGLDEFAKHPNAQLLWQTAQGRVTWNYDLAVWSSHDGEDTLFNQFTHQARANSPIPIGLGERPGVSAPALTEPGLSEPEPSPLQIENQQSTIKNPHNPWNLYYRVTMPDALEHGLLDIINRVQGTRLTPEEFLAGCRARAGSEEIFQQSYMCNPLGATTANIVDWSAIERCRYDYDIIRLHFEDAQILQQFGPFIANRENERQENITDFIKHRFLKLFQTRNKHRLGFDVAASGQGSLAVIYIDEARGDELWLRALFSCRTEDWHFLSTVLFTFLRLLNSLQAAGDSTGLGKQICWDAGKRFPGRFSSVNFSSKKHDLGFALMNQLATAQKRFPKTEQDIAADYFALRKGFVCSRWVFSEGRNHLNAASHCDIAWAGALATHAHTHNNRSVGARLG